MVHQRSSRLMGINADFVAGRPDVSVQNEAPVQFIAGTEEQKANTQQVPLLSQGQDTPIRNPKASEERGPREAELRCARRAELVLMENKAVPNAVEPILISPPLSPPFMSTSALARRHPKA